MRKSQESSFKLYSYRNVFNDGNDRLHPGFKLSKVLLVLTRTKPFHKRYIPLTGEELISKHLQRTVCYLTTADNQLAKRYNNARTGELVLPKENVAPLIPAQNFTFLTTFNMSDQTNAATTAKSPATSPAAKILILTTALNHRRALLVNPTVDGFPHPDSGIELPQFVAQINAQLPAENAQTGDSIFGHFASFLENGVPEANAPYFKLIEEPCATTHVAGCSDIITKALAESTVVDFNPTAFGAWFEAQADQTMALAVAYDAAFGSGDDQELATLEIGSTMHVAADPADAVTALQTAVDNAQPVSATTEGVVDATAVAEPPAETAPEVVAETTAPDAAAIPNTTPVAETTSPVVEDVDTTDGGSAIQSIVNHSQLIGAAAEAAEAAAGTFEAIAALSTAAAKGQRAVAGVLAAAGVTNQTVQLTANTPVEEVAA